MKRQRFLGILMVLALFYPSEGACVSIESDPVSYDAVNAKAEGICSWVNSQFSVAVPFNASTGVALPALFALGGVEVGVSAVYSSTKVDFDSLFTLLELENWTTAKPRIIERLKEKAPARLPFAGVFARAEFALPWSTQGVLRLGGFPEYAVDFGSLGSNRVAFKNTVYGIDVRKTLVADKPGRLGGLTVGLGYTRAEGEISLTSSIDYDQPVAGNKNTYLGAVTLHGAGMTAWKTNNLGAHAVLQKKLSFLTPYLGAAVSYASGVFDTSSSVEIAGEVHAADPKSNKRWEGSAAGRFGSAFSLEEWDARALAGLEISIGKFLNLGIHGEIAEKERYAAAVQLQGRF